VTNSTSVVIDEFLSTHTFRSMTTTLCIVAVLFLLVVFTEQQIVAAARPDRERRDLMAFAVVGVPLFLVFAAVIVARFIQLS
jgi:small-conductance mechanosensitive channel